MAWTLKDNTLFNKQSQELGYFLPTASEKERQIIRKGEDLLDIIGEFVMDYDEGKTPLKSIIDRMSKIVKADLKYNLIWTSSKNGELLNENDNVIFYFTKSSSLFVPIIKHLPELYSVAQSLLKNLSSTSRQETKRIYNQICDYYDKIDVE
jgi:hypothetical protein